MAWRIVDREDIDIVYRLQVPRRERNEDGVSRAAKINAQAKAITELGGSVERCL
jgi:hypothetical protein